MAKLLTATLAAAGCLLATVAQAQEVDYGTYVALGIENYIRPHTQAFEEASSRLPGTVEALCKTPSEETRAGFSETYRDVLIKFGGVSFLRFGPVIENNRLDSLAFMPDPRGITQRQIRRALAKLDDTLTNADTLKEKSVALQGLTALQLIAFDASGDVSLGEKKEGSDFICSYAGAIAENVHRIANEIAKGWEDDTGYSRELLSPEPEAAQVRSSKDAIETIFNALVTGFIVVKDQDLLPALGESREKARANRLPFSRSGNTRAFIQAELDGLEEALNALGFEPDLPAEFSWVPSSLTFEFDNARKNLASLPTPLKPYVKEAEVYGKLQLLTITINSLRDTTALSLAGAMNLTGGFNALDGD